MKLKEKRSAYSRKIEKKISKHNSNTRYLLAKLAVPAILALSTAANADGYPTCTTKVRWVVTIENQIAMTPIDISIRDSSNTIVAETNNHSGNVTLPCGKYHVTATLGHLTRGRTISANTEIHNVIIEMGE